MRRGKGVRNRQMRLWGHDSVLSNGMGLFYTADIVYVHGRLLGVDAG